MKTLKSRILTTVCTLALASCCAVSVEAQETDGASAADPQASPAGMAGGTGSPTAEPDNGALGDIVVTAQRRSQRLQDVPIAITALTGTQLQERGITSIQNIGKGSPGVLFSELGGAPTTTAISIRGVVQLDFSDNQESPIALYVDDAYVSFQGATGVGLFDVANVEVLRGPQGTLFGRNATGGLLSVTTNKPTETFSGYLNVLAGTYNTLNVEGAISDRIAENLSGRLSVSYNRQDGVYRNTLGPDVGEDDTLNLRGQLYYRGNGVEDRLVLTYSRTFPIAAGGFVAYPTAPNPANHNLGERNSGALFVANCAALGYAVAAGATDCYGETVDRRRGKWTISLPKVGSYDREIFSATNIFTAGLGATTLSSITNYAQLRKNYIENDSVGAIPIFGAGGADRYGPNNNPKAYQISQELRLNGTSGRLTWVVGAYGLIINGRYATSSIYGDIDTPDLVTGPRYSQKVRSVALFGQADYKLTPALTLIAGLRGNLDHKKVDLVGYCSADEATCAAYGSGPDGAGFSGKDNRSDWSGRLQLTYQIDRDKLIYAGVNRGNKASGVTVPLNSPLPSATFDTQLIKPEVLTAYEGGFKTSWAGGRLRVNGSAFYYDYSNLQAFRTSGFSAVLFNADAQDYGAELDVTVRPARDTTLSGNLALLHTSVKDVSLPDGTIADQRQALAPSVAWNLFGRQEVPLSSSRLFGQATVSHVSSHYFSTVNADATKADARTTVDLSLGWISGNGKTTITAAVRNLTNVAYAVYAYDLGYFAGYGLKNYGPPRMFTLQASRKF